MKFLRKILFILLFCYSNIMFGYQETTHEIMSQYAAEFSLIGSNMDILFYLGLKHPIDDIRQKFIISNGKKYTISELIQYGAYFEDDNIRPVNHFFDPVNDRALTIGGVAQGEKSPDWALEDSTDINEQDFSYKDARNSLYNALISTTQNEREQNFGLLFQTLGQVIHHIQDMAQPQHVRNDDHCNKWYCRIAALYHPSTYEKYTNIARDALPFTGYDPVFFSTPRQFWVTDETNGTGQGLAEFTNNNFVSAHTNFRGEFLSSYQSHPDYSLPNPAGAVIETKNIEDADFLGATQPLRGKMHFIGTQVTDKYTNAPLFNPRTSTYSIFDSDLKENNVIVSYSDPVTYTTKAIYSLNRFNYDSAHNFLIPRAIGYSAGLINYFFRGRLSAEGVAITDTGISLRVKNAIDPVISPELSNEILHARDSNSNPATLLIAFSYIDFNGIQQFGTSNTIELTAGDNIDPNQLSAQIYSFALTVPDDATDVEFRLVFRGKLGNEDNAVAFGKVNPVSGFVVNPNYTLDDGITGSRVIYYKGGKWQLDPTTGLEAGNIDWKGMYINGNPTKILTWFGPPSRYFPTPSGNPFSNDIFHNGERYTVTPYNVLGAAINKDVEGNEWVITICRNGNSDMVYRRPNNKNLDPGIYDPITNLEGWQEIGNYPAQTNAFTPDRPWFFNGHGTEAQTMRSVSTGGTIRLKINVSEDTSSLDNLGNTKISSTVHTETHYRNCEWWAGDIDTPYVNEIRNTTSQGSSVVAVDYKNNTEMLAKIEVNSTNNFNLEGQVFNNEFEAQQDSIRLDDESKVLVFDNTRTTIYKNKSQSNRHVLEIDLDPAPAYTSDSSTTNYINSYIVFMDMRNNFVVYHQTDNPYSYSATWTEFDMPGTYQSSGDNLFLNELKHDSLNSLIYSNTQSYSNNGATSFPISLVEPLIDCFDNPAMNRDDVQTNTYEYVEDIYVRNINGSFAIDSAGNLIFSMSYLDANSNTKYFHYLSNGDLNTLLPTAPANALLYPLGVIK